MEESVRLRGGTEGGRRPQKSEGDDVEASERCAWFHYAAVFTDRPNFILGSLTGLKVDVLSPVGPVFIFLKMRRSYVITCLWRLSTTTVKVTKKKHHNSKDLST